MDFQCLSAKFNSLGIVAQIGVITCETAQQGGIVGVRFAQHPLSDFNRLRTEFHSFFIISQFSIALSHNSQQKIVHFLRLFSRILRDNLFARFQILDGKLILPRI